MEDSTSVADHGCYCEGSCNRLLVLSGFGAWYSGWVRAVVTLRTAANVRLNQSCGGCSRILKQVCSESYAEEDY